MVELSLKNKKLPRLNIMHRHGSTKKQESRHHQSSLGSGVNSYNNTVSNSIIRNHNNDPYMPHIARPQRSSSSSLPQTSRPSKHPMRHHSSSSPYLPATRFVTDPPASPTSPASPSNTFYYNYPPLSPPPLSPTNLSFATSSRPSWREMARSPTYQPASSISSTDDDDEQDEDDSDSDDNAPLGLMLSPRPVGHGKPFSLLSDLEEDGDDDLVPIARLSISRESVHHMSAAEKYKQKVRARLQMGNSATTSNPFI
ncbi:hypothetical protein MAM1_0145c06523 [Mucor ambiguus]|uniref:Uncharacterized protein n=1 Tax=Mucor ambiguus TaxID=91626 RepID=A0A0C9MXU7_9FUNG|nr:hypothetical protein MAM1_0145c06523 [Mucor ambiguus]